MPPEPVNERTNDNPSGFALCLTFSSTLPLTYLAPYKLDITPAAPAILNKFLDQEFHCLLLLICTIHHPLSPTLDPQFVDFTKAFDSVGHKNITCCLRAPISCTTALLLIRTFDLTRVLIINANFLITDHSPFTEYIKRSINPAPTKICTLNNQEKYQQFDPLSPDISRCFPAWFAHPDPTPLTKWFYPQTMV